MKTLLIALLIALTLSACATSSEVATLNTTVVGKTPDGCTIYRTHKGRDTLYYARCDEVAQQ